MSVLYLDCFSGVAGDMLVGALLDLGASFEAVRDGLAQLDLAGCSVSFRHVDRGPIRAGKFDVHVSADDAPERGLAEIRALLAAADLPTRVHERALRAFALLADAEGRVHGRPAEEVHFHEVGALDAICDVVGTALALEDLGVDRIHVGPLRVGSGFVECRHGTLPVPAPATLGCLAGFEVRFEEGCGELVTPTGACLVGALAESGPPGDFVIQRVGHGAGERDPAGTPNVVRAVLGSTASGAEALLELRTNVDHLAPTVLAAAVERVVAAGAVDAFVVPCTMKKGRSGHLLTVLVPAAARDAVESAVFRETGTLGVRWTEVRRTVLVRSFRTVETAWGTVRVKIGTHAGRTTSAEPEFEDCRSLADEHGVAVTDVVAAARAASLGLPRSGIGSE